MTPQKTPPRDDPSSAPESGTVRDDTSGNRPAAGDERRQQPAGKKDDPSVAGEER